MAVLTDEITPVLAGVRRKLCKSSASDNMSGEKEFQFFEKAMQKAPGYRISKRTIPRSCKECEFYQPKWKYRSCYYVRCPYAIKGCTLREAPLVSDPFYPREVSLNGI